jgi:hypothetical protein
MAKPSSVAEADSAPPFVGFIELSQLAETTRDELLGKMLSGEHLVYVYSSETDGRLEPVRITPAEFFKAWRRAQQEAGCDDCQDASGWSLKKMGPFQIRVPDRDIRRDRQRLVRRTIGVPHWIYLLKADLALPRDGADDISLPKGKAGPPEIFDWIEIKGYFFKLLKTHDDPTDPLSHVEGWKSMADAMRAVTDYLQGRDEKVPEKTQLRGKLKVFLAEWVAAKSTN